MKRPYKKYRVTWTFPTFNWICYNGWEYTFCKMYYVYNADVVSPSSWNWRVSRHTPNRLEAEGWAKQFNEGGKYVTN